MSSLFSITWDAEVKKLAQDCVKEPELVRILGMPEDYKLTDDEEKYLKSIEGKYKDPYGMYYISEMIWSVEHALEDNREYLAKLAVMKVYQAIISDNYLKDVFKSDKSSEEWKRIETLSNGLVKLISI